MAGRLLGAALVDEAAWKKLSHISTHVGHSLSGSPQLEEALRWISERMKADGLDNVRLQPVKVPHWVRREESAQMTTPAALIETYSRMRSQPGIQPDLGLMKRAIGLFGARRCPSVCIAVQVQDG